LAQEHQIPREPDGALRGGRPASWPRDSRASARSR
jgi:hypothetical protein